MNNQNEFIDHEVRIRFLEEIQKDNKLRFDRLYDKIDSHFRWTLGTVLSVNIATMCLMITIMIYLIG